MQCARIKDHFLSAAAGVVFAGEFNQVASDFTGVATDSIKAIAQLYTQGNLVEMGVGTTTLTASAFLFGATAYTCKRHLFPDRSAGNTGPA